MTWIIIIVVLALVIGPAMYLKPSAKDKRLVELRGRARTLGLTVAIEHIPKLNASAEERVSSGGELRNPRIAIAAYKLGRGDDAQEIDELMLLRIPEDVNTPIREESDGWAVAKGTLKAGSNGQQKERIAPHRVTGPYLQKWLAGFGESVVGVAVDGRFISCYWREPAGSKSEDVDEICARLKEGRSLFEKI